MSAKKALIAVGLVLTVSALLLAAAGPAVAGGSGNSGNSGSGHLYLYQMTAFPGGAVVDGGAVAKLTYQFSEVAYEDASGAFAASFGSNGKNNGNGHGNGNKNKAGDDIESGGYTGAELTSITFNAHGLEAGETYYLIYSAGASLDSAPSAWLELGYGQANGGGNLHIGGSALQTGALTDLLLWLVPASDWSQGSLSMANLADYLYAEQLLFTDYGN